MSQYDELKRLAEAHAQKDAVYPIESTRVMLVEPKAVLALIADLDEARNGMKHSCAIRLKKEIKRLESEAVYSAAGFDAAREEISKLRAEVAGLRTGYEAYERVNAELKAECARSTEREILQLAEIEALRKDSESYRLLSFCHGQGTLELVRSHHELCAEIRRLKILAGEPVPPTPEEFVGPSPEGPTARIRRKIAALGQGEQS